jgi:hypothetical protein
MKEVVILLNESTFTNLCKIGFIKQKNFMFSGGDIYITKIDMVELINGKIIEKIVDDCLYKIAIQNIDIDLIKEIIIRSPIYSDINENILFLNR